MQTISALTPPFLPLWLTGVFTASSLLMIWRLELMSRKGVEGTVLGTLVMPYCSGLGNLVFVFVLVRQGGPGAEVITNCLVNNVTNLTLLLGLPVLLWGCAPAPAGKKRKHAAEQQLHKLSLLLTLLAALFFSGAAWALGRDGRIDFGDGLVLVGLFLFWQCFHVFEVLKTNVRQNKRIPWSIGLDLLLLGAGAFGVYYSVEGLVDWLSAVETGFFSAAHLGWITGWLMVLPNALLAFYYAWRGRPEILYTSQVGDGHICVPLCIGLFALFHPIETPDFFELGILILGGVALFHFTVISLWGRLPRGMGLLLGAVYALFVYRGLIA